MKKIFSLSLIAIFIFSLSSCLKDELVENQEYGLINLNTKKIIGFNDFTQSFALPFEDKERILNIPIRLSSEKPAEEDITVTLSLDNSEELIDEYNTAEKKDLLVFNPDLYELQGSGLSVLIPKGTNEGVLSIKVNAITFDPSTTYALGFTIKSASGSSNVVSGNLQNIIVSFGAKNFFDGMYKYTTSANTSLVPNANKSVSLTTVGANRCQLNPGLLGSYTNEVYYTIDPSTNAVTVECPSLGVQTPQDVRSVYDPATKTLKVYWKQGNGGRTFEETFVYTGPRG